MSLKRQQALKTWVPELSGTNFALIWDSSVDTNLIAKVYPPQGDEKLTTKDFLSRMAVLSACPEMYEACRAMDFSFTDLETKDGRTTALRRFNLARQKAKKAIQKMEKILQDHIVLLPQDNSHN